MKYFGKKRIATLLILLIMVPLLSAAPRRARAILGVGDLSFDPTVFQEVLFTYIGDIEEYAARAAQWVEENWQKVMRDVIAKRIIDYTVDETIKWVQGGGDPKFISDWDGFMREAGEMAFDSVIKEAELSDICEPFALQLRVALIPETRFKRERVDCTISDIVANVQDFYDNFQNGGWLAYGESIKPENNLYMQIVMFDDKVALRTAFNEDQQQQKAATGQGFLSVSKCVEDSEAQEYQSCIEGRGGSEAECRSYAQQAKVCTKEEVQTPGSIVGKAVGESITSDTVWAANIQSWTSALVNAAINRLTKEGVAAMTGSSSGARADYDAASSEYGSIKEAEMKEDRKDLIDQVETLAGPYRQLLTEKQTAKGYTEQTLDLFAQMDVMDKNKVCVPQTTAAEVSAQQTILSTLTKRVNELQPVVTEGDAIITRINTMTDSTRDMSLIMGTISTYLGKYKATDQAQVHIELQDMTDSATQLTTLQNVQGRYAQCKAKLEILGVLPVGQ